MKDYRILTKFRLFDRYLQCDLAVMKVCINSNPKLKPLEAMIIMNSFSFLPFSFHFVLFHPFLTE